VVIGHSRSLKLVPFKSFGAVSYPPSILTICDILYRLRDSDLLVENRKIFIPHLHLVLGGDPVGISWRCLILVKLEWLGYRMVKNLWRYVKPFSSDTGTSRTDGRTYRIAISISRVSVLTHDKNWHYFMTDFDFTIVSELWSFQRQW